MKTFSYILILLLLISCNSNQKPMKKIIFLHHSTGQGVWYGETNRYVRKLTGKSDVKTFFNRYNRKNKTNFEITELSFPKKVPYGWQNYPYDYYNIWVKNAGDQPYMEEPTLEILTKEYDVIIFKHCYPVSKILEDTGTADINSKEKRLENYKLQYEALKKKMHEFPNNKFIVWTPAVHVKSKITKEEAERTQQFYKWIKNEWNENGDNIYLWDFYKYETEGDLYLKEEYASNPNNSHPNKEFNAKMAKVFGKFVIDVAGNEVENVVAEVQE